MPDLSFRVEGAEPQRFAAEPLLDFRLHVAEAGTPPTPIHAVNLRCQVRIEPARRSYSAAEQQRLVDLFGTPERWGQTVRPMLWTHVSSHAAAVHRQRPRGPAGAVQLRFQSGGDEVFRRPGGRRPAAVLSLQRHHLLRGGGRAACRWPRSPWEKEATFRLPAATWQELMDLYYPNSAWLCLRRDVFDRLSPLQKPAGVADLGAGAGTVAGCGRGGGDTMNRALVDRIADAVLYEGYILYPYRPSTKNRQRWTFGGLYPEAYCQAQASGEASSNQTECLVTGGPTTRFEATVRFLHLTARLVGEVVPPVTNWHWQDGTEPPFRPVETLRVGDKHLQTWQEAEEREVALDAVTLGELLTAPRRLPFSFPGGRRSEPVREERWRDRRRPGARASRPSRESSRRRRPPWPRGCSA